MLCDSRDALSRSKQSLFRTAKMSAENSPPLRREHQATVLLIVLIEA
jgi:hypothetical protein